MRMLIATMIILAIAGLQWLTPIAGMNIFFILDRSDSVPTSQQETAREWIRRVASDKVTGDRAGLVVFGSDASIEAAAGVALDLQKIEAVVPTARTDIGGAIQLASAAFPEFGQRRIVLVSDGNENLSDALNAAVSARALDVNVDVVPVGSERMSDISIQRLQLPSTVKQGQSFETKVFVQADEPGPAIVRLYRNEHYLGEQSINLESGKNLFTFPQTLPDSGFYKYDVRLDAVNDRVLQNNRAFAFTQVRGVPRVLIVSTDPAEESPLARALKSPDLDVKLTGVNEFPGSLAELQSYDALIFCNILAGDLSRDQQNLLETAVRDFGLGFVCVGGDQAYAAGAYRGTPIANILPVEVELSSKKVLPPGALVLVVDQSGSMVGEKLEMARQAAAGAVHALAPSDYVGVIAFDGAPHVIVDLQRAGDRREIIGSIMGIGNGGGTVMYPPMVRAHEMLRNATASFKHCIILTDGVSQPGDFDGITRAMVADRITVSTVGIGQDIDGNLLEGIAGIGKGRFYPVPFPNQLPQIFIKETAVVLKSAINEEPFMPRLVSSSELVRGISAAEYPQLLGYVITEPKARAETPLLTDKGDPLLAHWQYGLGRAVAFTSDARAKWAKHWIEWGRYQQFWRQVVQWSLRRLQNADLTIEVTSDRGEGRINVEALDERGNFRNFLSLQSAVVAPTGEKQIVRLQQTGPGHYEATFPMRETGAYLLNVMQMENGQVRAAQVVGASLNYSPELDASVPNLNLLRRIAESTGGKVLDASRPGSNPFYDDRRKTWRPYDLWESLLKVAIILFVLDVGVRRVQLERDEVERAARSLLGLLPFWPKPAPASVSTPSLAALLAHRQELQEQNVRLPTRLMAARPIITAPMSKTPQASTVTSEQPVASQIEAGTTARLLEAKRRAHQRRDITN